MRELGKVYRAIDYLGFLETQRCVPRDMGCRHLDSKAVLHW